MIEDDGTRCPRCGSTKIIDGPEGGGGQDFLKNIAYIQQATGKDLGFDLSKGTYDIYKLSDALADLKGKVTSGQYLQFTQAIGINPESLVLLEKGSAYLHTHEEEFSKLTAAMDANANAMPRNCFKLIVSCRRK